VGGGSDIADAPWSLIPIEWSIIYGRYYEKIKGKMGLYPTQKRLTGRITTF
jgi:hypothetical protein